MFREKLRIGATFFEKVLRNWPKRPFRIVVWVEGKTGVRTGARKRQAMQSGTHFAKTGGFRLHGARLFHACWGAAPIPAEHKNCVLERWINPSAARFFKSLMGRQLSAALPLFPVVHSLPPAPCPAPEYGRYWPWPSAALSFPRGPCGSRCRRISSPPAARRTRYSAP